MFNKNNKPDKNKKETSKPSPFSTSPSKIPSPKGSTSFSSSSAGSGNAINIISPGTRIEGEIYSNGDIRIDGVVDGFVNTKAKVVVGPKGMVKGEMTCDSADVTGKIDGKLTVRNELYLKSTAYITGELNTHKLVVESGAFINGNCIVGKQTITNQSGESKPSGGLAGKFKKKEAI